MQGQGSCVRGRGRRVLLLARLHVSLCLRKFGGRQRVDSTAEDREDVEIPELVNDRK